MPPEALVWKAAPGMARAPIAPRRFIRQREGAFAGKPMAYTVIAGDTALKDNVGRPIGSIFSFSYVAKVPAGSQRPVVFIFNGGPGSSSLWLQMGILGPRKVAFNDGAPSQVPPYRTINNPDSLLAVADLVFIDPIGTGFSRYWGDGKPDDFYGREEDAKATVDFIQSWLRANHRWNSPKFLLGESYGTTRAALVSRRLFGGAFQGTLRGIALNGVIMMGGNGGLAAPKGNEVHATTFTTMAAAAWYHGKVRKEASGFEAFIAAADRFAQGELVPAMNRWEALDATSREALARKEAGFLGLPAALLLAKNLKEDPSDFQHDLLVDQHKVLGTYDGRYVLPAANSLHDPVGDDAAMGQYSPAFIGAFNSYIRDDLGIDIDDDYTVIDFVNVNFPFSMRAGEDVSTGADFAATLRRNPDMQFLSVQGWFDMFGAVGSAHFGIVQRQLPPAQVEEKAYWSGHMAYVGEAGVKLAADLRQFIQRASAGRSAPVATSQQVGK